VILRFLDIFLSLIGLIIIFPILSMLLVLGYLDTGSPLFKQERVGRYNKAFTLYKLRSMKLDTSNMATHLASPNSITKWGHFIRKSKLDELPQLLNVFFGDMSLVGPRPCLFNQAELMYERDIRGVSDFRPGITGLAQVSKIDMSTPELLAKTDAIMIENISLKHYIKFIVQTALGKGSGDRVN
jgi:O-antigen biosynthesis protein WbqP